MTIQTPDSIYPIVDEHPHRQLFGELPTAIQRCDQARALLLEEFGSIYSDLDVQPFRSLDWLCGLFPHARVLLIEEVTFSRRSSIRRRNRYPIREGNPEIRLRVGNFWMASAPGHLLWRDVPEMIEERSHLTVTHDYDVIFTTGPDIISEVTTGPWAKMTTSYWPSAERPGDSSDIGLTAVGGWNEPVSSGRPEVPALPQHIFRDSMIG